MITSKELELGNIVAYETETGETTPMMKVEGILRGKVFLVPLHGQQRAIEVPEEKLKEIPLSEKLVEKLGFRFHRILEIQRYELEKHPVYQDRRSSCTLTFNGTRHVDVRNAGNCISDVSSLHALQKAYRNCSIFQPTLDVSAL